MFYPFPSVFPGIHKILGTRDSLSGAKSAEVREEQIEESLSLINTWKIHSGIRISFGVAAWALTAAVAILV